MKALVCEMCGGQDLVKQDGMYICSNCNTKYTTEEAKKLMVEVEGKVDVTGSTVRVDQSDTVERMRQAARTARDMGNSKNAADYYGMVAMHDPNDWEAVFYSVYYTSMQTNIAGIANATIRVANSLSSVMELIKLKSSAERDEAVKEVRIRCDSLSTIMSDSATNHYNGIDASIQDKYKDELAERYKACRDMMYILGDLISRNFDDSKICRTQAVLAWRKGLLIQRNSLNKLSAFLSKYSDEENVYKYERKIGEYDPAFKKENIQKWIRRKEVQIQNAESNLKNLENGKNAFNPKKIPGTVICAVIAVVSWILVPVFFNNYVNNKSDRNIGTLLLEFLFITLGVTFTIIGLVQLKSVFPSKKKRAQIENDITNQKRKIENLNKEYKELLEEANKE